MLSVLQARSQIGQACMAVALPDPASPHRTEWIRLPMHALVFSYCLHIAVLPGLVYHCKSVLTLPARPHVDRCMPAGSSKCHHQLAVL